MTRESHVDDVLRSWLAEGSERAPERHVSAAMERIRSTSQVPTSRWPAFLDGASHVRMAAFAMVGVLVVVAVALAISARVGNTPTPSLPIPAASAQASIEPGPSTSLIFPSDGYEIALPDGWSEGSSDWGVSLSAVGPDMDLLVLAGHVDERSGQADGLIEACRFVGREDCWSVSATSLGELVGAVHADPLAVPSSSSLVQRRDFTMDGEPAVFLRFFGPEYPEVAFVVAVHESRPYLLRFAVAGGGRVEGYEALTRGFRFLDRTPVLYTSAEDGYQVQLPEWWARTADRRTGLGGDPAADVTFFGTDGADGLPGLSISVGEPDGSVAVCNQGCRNFVATSLEELERAVVSTPSFMCTSASDEARDCRADLESRRELVLGGEPARLEEAAVGNACGGCPGAYTHVFAIHDGRPVVLAFDYWNLRYDRFSWYANPEELLSQIVDSFVFTDAPVPADRHVYRYPVAGFQVELDDAWSVTNSDPSTLIAVWRGLSLFITSGDADGEVRTCDTPAGPWLIEDCGPHPADAIPRYLGGTLEETQLDGERATIERVTGYEDPARGAQAIARVVATHNGRTFVIRVWSPGARIEAIDDIISGFEFLDVEAGDSFTTFPALDASFQIRLPDAWTLDHGPDPAALYLTRRNIDLSIRAANADGEVLTCDGAEAPWETCKTSTATTLEELRRDVTLKPSGESTGPYARDATLDGEPARVEEIVAQGFKARGAQWVSYVMAMHDGRPFVIRLWSATLGDGHGDRRDPRGIRLRGRLILGCYSAPAFFSSNR